MMSGGWPKGLGFRVWATAKVGLYSSSPSLLHPSSPPRHLPSPHLHKSSLPTSYSLLPSPPLPTPFSLPLTPLAPPLPTPFTLPPTLPNPLYPHLSPSLLRPSPPPTHTFHPLSYARPPPPTHTILPPSHAPPTLLQACPRMTQTSSTSTLWASTRTPCRWAVAANSTPVGHSVVGTRVWALACG